MNDSEQELKNIISTLRELDEGIWQLLNREIDAGHVFSNKFIEDMGMLTVKAKFYVMKYGTDENHKGYTSA